MSQSNNPPTQLEMVKHWLRVQLRQAVNVQACHLTNGNSLVVQTWTGVIINIYLLDAPVKTRAIKRLLQESSEIGVGSMFIVSADLMPENNARFELKEWLQAIHDLTRERVYAYGIGEDNEPALSQAHFEAHGSSGEYIARYGPPVTFEQVRYYRISVKPRAIKGDWQVADFGFYAFWKDPYKPFEATYRRPSAGDYTTWRAWGYTGTWEQTESTPLNAPPIRRDKLTISYEVLALQRGATRDEVKAAFRRLAIQYHPDTSQLPKEDAEARFRQITEAYEFIKEHHNW